MLHKGSQDATQENQLKTLRRGREKAQTKGNQDTTQENQPKTLRRGQRTAFQSSMLRRYIVGSRCADFSRQTRGFAGERRHPAFSHRDFVALLLHPRSLPGGPLQAERHGYASFCMNTGRLRGIN